MAEIPVIARLASQVRDKVLNSAQIYTCPAGQLIVRQGEVANAFFVLVSGEALITANLGGRNVELGRLSSGDFFGEQALLPESSGRRIATIQSMNKVRCARIPAHIFQSDIATQPENLCEFNEISLQNLRQTMVRSLDALRGLALSEPLGDSVTRQNFEAGQQVIRSGDSSDAVYFVLDGVALAYQDQGDGIVELSRAGPGQCFGQLGVVGRKPRSATVLAETALSLVRIEAETFRAWYDEHPELQDFLGTLEQVYPLADGGRLSVYRGTYEGRPGISTICGDPAGDCVVSTKVIGEDVIVFSLGGEPAVEEVIRFEDEDTGRLRELRLKDVRRSEQGKITEARVAGVVSRQLGPDVGHLYRKVSDQTIITPLALKRFRHLGYFGGETSVRDADHLCTCLRIGQDDALSAAAEYGSDAKVISLATGIGLVCGACIPDLEGLLAGDIRLEAENSLSPWRAQPEAHVQSKLVARWPDIQFDIDSLLELGCVPEFQLMATASIFASTGERFMIRHVSEAMATVSDQQLLADAEVFLAQESNHVTAHASLNQLLLEHVFPESQALSRLARPLLKNDSRISPRLALAICAAFEYMADCIFAIFFEHYYRSRRYHTDPAVNETAIRSGMADLFHWHGAEELAHRHVAYEMMLAKGGTYWTRVAGFGIFTVLVIRLILPAIISIRHSTTGRSASKADGISASSIILTTIWRTLKFLRPGFDPEKVEYDFMPDLARDAERFPVA